jgi:hypothetical protein
MPRLLYQDVNDPGVTPRQHILRALGGPLLNAILLPLALIWRWRARPGSLGREAAVMAVDTNAFLLFNALAPLPMIDGGPLLKWGLVARGCTPQQAAEIVRKVDGAIAPLYAASGLVEFRRRRTFMGIFMSMMAGSSLAYWRGWLPE